MSRPVDPAHDNHSATRPSPVGQIVLLYAVLAGLWILTSDWILTAFGTLEDDIAWIQTAKGLGFVAVTTLLLWLVLRRFWDAQVEAERRARHAQRLESVGRLAGGIAHDFNNLLTAITGYSDLLLGRTDLEETTRSDVEQIQSAAGKAAALTRQLLAFSRRQRLEMHTLDLNEVIHGLEGILRRLIREDIELVTHLAPDLGNVEADPGQLEQALMNLAVNASDAMPDGGSLILGTRNVELDGSRMPAGANGSAGAHVMMTVTDTGVGMDARTASRAFDPFFTTKGKGRGTGLGLASVYGIVKQHDGAIWVDSEPGEGTTFTICLPRVERPAETYAGHAASRAEVEGSETILLVEDQDEVRRATRRVLESMGYRVLAAAHPEEALRRARQGPDRIDVLLTDMVMPGVGGPELADELRRLLPDLPVVFISGYADPFNGARSLPAGQAYLNKPFTPVELGEKVREVLAASRCA